MEAGRWSGLWDELSGARRVTTDFSGYSVFTVAPSVRARFGAVLLAAITVYVVDKANRSVDNFSFGT